MRNSTAVLLLAVVLAVAAFGWQAISWITFAILAAFVLVTLLAAVAVWAIRRRMRRDLQKMMKTLGHHAPSRSGDSDVIDVEAKDVREVGR